MARSKYKKEEPEVESGGEEYVVESLKDHKRKKNGLEYRVKWKGYDKASDDTWEPEASLSGCTLIVEKYWSSKAPEEQLERFKVGSKDYKNLKAKLDAEEEEDVATQVKKPNTKSKSVSPSKKRTSSSRGADAELSEKPKANKRSKKAQVEEAEEEVEQDDEEASEAGFDAAGKLSVEWKEVADSTEPNSWEDLIERIDTCEKDAPEKGGALQMLVIWKKQTPEGDLYESWVESTVTRQTCPQKCLDFYETNLRFKQTVDEGKQATPEEEEGHQVVNGDGGHQDEQGPVGQEQEQQPEEKVSDGPSGQVGENGTAEGKEEGGKGQEEAGDESGSKGRDVQQEEGREQVADIDVPMAAAEEEVAEVEKAQEGEAPTGDISVEQPQADKEPLNPVVDKEPLNPVVGESSETPMVQE
ncbi:hypothetical protein JCM16303_001006 [Sporobolomyces ruberrimus]